MWGLGSENDSPLETSRAPFGHPAGHIRLSQPCKPALYRSRFLGRGCDEALFSEKTGFSVKRGGGTSVNEGLGKDFYRKGNSVRRSGPFSEPPDS